MFLGKYRNERGQKGQFTIKQKDTEMAIILEWSSLLSIPQTDSSLFIQLIRRTVYVRLQIYFNETKILNKLRRFTIVEAVSDIH